MMARESRARLLLAFLAVYTIWGSTYLAIRVAIATIPPFAMAGSRFVVAGLILYAWARWRGTPAPTSRQWRSAAVIGTLLLVGGNGGVVWSEQRVASGLAALMVGGEPLWAVLLDWLRPGGRRPSLGVGIGLAMGFIGVALLVSPGSLGGGPIDPLGAAALVVSTITWAMGSIYSRQADAPRDPVLSIGANMICGGIGLAILSLASGELSRLDAAAFATQSVLAWAYLTAFGSIVGFSSYMWLLRHTTLARASTYAYVNPVVAVFLGWLVLGEVVSVRTGVAAAVIIGAVILISAMPYLAGRRDALPAVPPLADAREREDARQASGPGAV